MADDTTAPAASNFQLPAKTTGLPNYFHPEVFGYDNSWTQLQDTLGMPSRYSQSWPWGNGAGRYAFGTGAPYGQPAGRNAPWFVTGANGQAGLLSPTLQGMDGQNAQLYQNGGAGLLGHPGGIGGPAGGPIQNTPMPNPGQSAAFNQAIANWHPGATYQPMPQGSFTSMAGQQGLFGAPAGPAPASPISATPGGPPVNPPGAPPQTGLKPNDKANPYQSMAPNSFNYSGSQAAFGQPQQPQAQGQFDPANLGRNDLRYILDQSRAYNTAGNGDLYARMFPGQDVNPLINAGDMVKGQAGMHMKGGGIYQGAQATTPGLAAYIQSLFGSR